MAIGRTPPAARIGSNRWAARAAAGTARRSGLMAP